MLRKKIQEMQEIRWKNMDWNTATKEYLKVYKKVMFR